MPNFTVPGPLLCREAYPDVHRRAPLLPAAAFPAVDGRQRSPVTQTCRHIRTRHGQQIQCPHQDAATLHAQAPGQEIQTAPLLRSQKHRDRHQRLSRFYSCQFVHLFPLCRVVFSRTASAGKRQSRQRRRSFTPPRQNIQTATASEDTSRGELAPGGSGSHWNRWAATMTRYRPGNCCSGLFCVRPMSHPTKASPKAA